MKYFDRPGLPGGVLLVIDGLSVDTDGLSWILRTHEGWEFELRLKDSTE